jgi:BirA family biotin operon repressor/biotin-[acetyl-CoA-carboxylase] ligase
VPQTHKVKKAAPARAPLMAQLFAALADGKFHSGEALAQELGVSRSAVWKAAGALRALGTALEAVRNRGYRLTHPSELLEAAKIRAAIPRELRGGIVSLEALWSTASTNTALLARENPRPGTSEVLLAEFQSAGRGRRGRAWLAPPGAGICLSLNWTFLEAPQALGALGLVIGVCVLRALEGLGVKDLALKWPNDLLAQGRKLGGILIELRGESAGPACVVIGIGLNVALGAGLLEKIAATGVAATDLASAGLRSASRNKVVAAIVSTCLRGLAEFERESLKPFLESWRSADALMGKEVNVTGAQGVSAGVARGIDMHGALLLETPAGVQRFLSGDVSVRPT